MLARHGLESDRDDGREARTYADAIEARLEELHVIDREDAIDRPGRDSLRHDIHDTATGSRSIQRLLIEGSAPGGEDACTFRH